MLGYLVITETVGATGRAVGLLVLMDALLDCLFDCGVQGQVPMARQSRLLQAVVAAMNPAWWPCLQPGWAVGLNAWLGVTPSLHQVSLLPSQVTAH